LIPNLEGQGTSPTSWSRIVLNSVELEQLFDSLLESHERIHRSFLETRPARLNTKREPRLHMTTGVTARLCKRRVAISRVGYSTCESTLIPNSRNSEKSSSYVRSTVHDLCDPTVQISLSLIGTSRFAKSKDFSPQIFQSLISRYLLHNRSTVHTPLDQWSISSFRESEFCDLRPLSHNFLQIPDFRNADI
jgi:hypothetical protein